MVANEFVGLAEGVGEGIVREELVGAFVGLLKDNEAEVRTAAAGQIPGTLFSLLYMSAGLPPQALPNWWIVKYYSLEYSLAFET